MSSALTNLIWETRYRLRTPQAEERSIEDTWDRVALAAASIERHPRRWSDTFSGILQNFRFLPGGRILAGAGTERPVTLCNCFVMGRIEDSIHGIFEALKEGAVTMQQGGGVGYDFSTLRPHGSRAHAGAATASGPVSFMHVWDAMCATMTATGSRRGAMMATLRCDHPDIETFIEAKRRPGVLQHFNLSVLVSDAFIQAVRDDAPWPLVFPASHLEAVEDDGSAQHVQRLWSGEREPVPCRVLRTLPARMLWEKLCTSACASAEPGVLFIDRINARDSLGYRETITATNPCGEVPLPPYGACVLGAVNLAAAVQQPFSPNAALDMQAIRATTTLAVRFLDNVIDITHFPLEVQREEALATRRIGLGVTGLADALAMLGLHYDSAAARQTAADIMCAIRDAACSASSALARLKGPFPAFERDRFLERPFIQALPQPLRQVIAQHGLRNGQLLAIAPAGSISLLAGNLSSGIEPIFRLHGQRRIRMPDGDWRNVEVTDHACALWRSLHRKTALPEYIVEAGDIPTEAHLLMQAALQPFVDASISKTVPLPADAGAQAVAQLYSRAYALELKGCTVFRRDSRAAVIDGQ